LEEAVQKNKKKKNHFQLVENMAKKSSATVQDVKKGGHQGGKRSGWRRKKPLHIFETHKKEERRDQLEQKKGREIVKAASVITLGDEGIIDIFPKN